MYLKSKQTINGLGIGQWPQTRRIFEEHSTLFTEIWMFIEIRMLKSASKGSEESEKRSREKTFNHHKQTDGRNEC